MVKPSSPTDFQKNILYHVARYRLTVDQAVHRLFCPEMTRDAARKSLERLKEKSLLQSIRVKNRTFYYLTPDASSLLGIPPSRSDHLGTQALVEKFAMLAFCCLGSSLRERLTPAEFKVAFPEFAGSTGIKAAHQHYYYDQQEQNWYLARATVDTGGSLECIQTKCRRFARHAATTPVLRDLVNHQHFMLTILTGEESKAIALAQLLEKESTNIRYRVVQVPEIAEIL